MLLIKVNNCHLNGSRLKLLNITLLHCNLIFGRLVLLFGKLRLSNYWMTFIREIFSFGQLPYTGMSNGEAVDRVINGYRLPPPPMCPENIYKMMLECWAEAPENRYFFILHTNSYLDLHSTKSITLSRKNGIASRYATNKPENRICLLLKTSLINHNFCNSIFIINNIYLKKMCF